MLAVVLAALPSPVPFAWRIAVFVVAGLCLMFYFSGIARTINGPKDRARHLAGDLGRFAERWKGQWRGPEDAYKKVRGDTELWQPVYFGNAKDYYESLFREYNDQFRYRVTIAAHEFNDDKTLVELNRTPGHPQWPDDFSGIVERLEASAEKGRSSRQRIPYSKI
jgi:hypothetical protein